MIKVKDLIVRIRAILSDPDSDRWKDETLVAFINDAQQDYCTKTEILRLSSTLYLHSNQAVYSVPRMLKLIKATNLELIAHNTLDITKPNWEDETADLDYIPTGEDNEIIPKVTHSVYGRLSRGSFRVYPVPTFVEPEIFDPNTKNKLKLYFIAKPIALTTVEDIVDSNVPVQVFEYFVSAKLLKADQDTQNRSFGNEQWALYLAEIESAKEDIAIDFIKDDSNEAHKDTTKAIFYTPEGAFSDNSST